MKKRRIILCGEILSNSVNINRCFDSICQISPIILRDFIKIIDKIRWLDEAVSIRGYEFSDYNSIDIKFNNRTIEGCARLSFIRNRFNNLEMNDYELQVSNIEETPKKEIETIVKSEEHFNETQKEEIIEQIITNNNEDELSIENDVFETKEETPDTKSVIDIHEDKPFEEFDKEIIRNEPNKDTIIEDNSVVLENKTEEKNSEETLNTINNQEETEAETETEIKSNLEKFDTQKEILSEVNTNIEKTENSLKDNINENEEISNTCDIVSKNINQTKETEQDTIESNEKFDTDYTEKANTDLEIDKNSPETELKEESLVEDNSTIELENNNTEEVLLVENEENEFDKLSVFENINSEVFDCLSLISKFSGGSEFDISYDDYELQNNESNKEDFDLNSLNTKNRKNKRHTISREEKIAMYQSLFKGFDKKLTIDKINNLKDKIRDIQSNNISSDEVLDAQIDLIVDDEVKAFKIWDKGVRDDVLELGDNIYLSHGKVYCWGDTLLLEE